MLSLTYELLADDLHKHALLAPAVELVVKDVIPGAEVELALGNRCDHVPPHSLPVVMGIGVVLTGPVMMVPLGRRIKRGELFEPFIIIAMQPGLVVVNKNAGRDVHCIDKR